MVARVQRILHLNGAHDLEKAFTAQGYGVLVLDSFSTRNVSSVCGDANYHWAIRRVEDAYAALDYLIENKLAKPDGVFVMGRSNGALTAIMITEDYEVRDHQHHFAGTFALSPTCVGLEKSTFAIPIVIFTGDKDQAAVNPKYCESLNRPTGSPVRVIEYKGVYHGYEDIGADSVFHGWRMEYNAKAENHTMATIYSLIKTKQFERGVEYR
jgi:dienelactone hydrolase